MMDDLKNLGSHRTPSSIDIAVGARIRAKRRILGMSQATLAETVGVTFQQVQKYEKGTNRVGASRLLAVANVLGEPVSYFFDGQPDDRQQDLSTASHTASELGAFLETNEGRNLNLAFARIKEPRLRKRVVSLVKALAGTDADMSHGEP